MREKKNYIYSFFALCIAISLYSQDSRERFLADSIKSVLKTNIHDTTRCNLLNVLIDREPNDNIWPQYNDEIGKIAERNLERGVKGEERKIFLKYMAVNLNNNGFLYDSKGDGRRALEYYTKTLAIMRELDNKHGISISLNNIGFIHDSWGDVTRALEFYLEGLKISEQTGDKREMAVALVNVATVYESQGDTANALKYYRKSFIIRKLLGDKHGIANSLQIIANLYFKRKDFDKAMEYFLKSLAIRQEIGDKHGMATSMGSLGSLNTEKGNYKSALEYHFKSLQLYEELEDIAGVAQTLDNIGNTYISDKKYKEGLQYNLKALALSKKIGYPDELKTVAGHLYLIYKHQKKGAEALEMHELYIKMKDSLNNAETRKGSLKKQFEYDYGKRVAQDSVRNQEKIIQENIEFEETLKQQQLVTYLGLGAFFLMLVTSLVSFTAYRNKQKANAEIESQKAIIDAQTNLVEEKQKEIIDSITYARRIQSVLMASETYIDRCLQELQKMK